MINDVRFCNFVNCFSKVNYFLKKYGLSDQFIVQSDSTYGSAFYRKGWQKPRKFIGSMLLKLFYNTGKDRKREFI